MPHQCVHCGKVYPDAAEELLKGCACGSHFFYYIKKEYAERLKKEQEKVVNEALGQESEEKEEREKQEGQEQVDLIQEKIEELNKVDKKEIEKEVREIMGIEEKEDIPVILDLESIKVLKPGKFEIDVVNLFSKKRPLIYKLEEGKYIIDLASTIKVNAGELKNKIVNPEED